MENNVNNKKQIVTWVIVGVVVALVVIYLIVKGGGIKAPVSNNQGGIQTASGTVAVTGTSPVNAQGEVIAPSGKVADNSSVPGSLSAPQQSAPIDATQVPPSAVKLEISAAGFVPSTFTVKAGAAVTLSLTGTDDQTHVLRFDDPSLQGVAIGIGPGMTRVTTFNAPSKSGDYSFHCDVPGHASRGEVGKMVVQ